jgi:hypothetical protein
MVNDPAYPPVYDPDHVPPSLVGVVAPVKARAAVQHELATRTASHRATTLRNPL